MTEHEDNLNLDAKLAALEPQLKQALRVQPPADLADRITIATASRLHQRLSDSMKVAAPRGLASRIAAASSPFLPAPAVVARIGWAFRTYASAAAVILLVGGAIWLNLKFQARPAAHPRITAVNIAKLHDKLDRMEMAMHGPIDPLDAQIAALAIEVDQASWAVRSRPGDEFMDNTATQLGRDLEAMEERLGAF